MARLRVTRFTLSAIHQYEPWNVWQEEKYCCHSPGTTVLLYCAPTPESRQSGKLAPPAHLERRKFTQGTQHGRAHQRIILVRDGQGSFSGRAIDLFSFNLSFNRMALEAEKSFKDTPVYQPSMVFSLFTTWMGIMWRDLSLTEGRRLGICDMMSNGPGFFWGAKTLRDFVLRPIASLVMVL